MRATRPTSGFKCIVHEVVANNVLARRTTVMAADGASSRGRFSLTLGVPLCCDVSTFLTIVELGKVSKTEIRVVITCY